MQHVVLFELRIVSAHRESREKPYCSEHIAEFLSAGNEIEPETADVQSSAAQPKQTNSAAANPAATNPSSTCSCHSPRSQPWSASYLNRSIGSSNPTGANPKLRAVPTELSTAGGSADGWKPLPSPNHGQPWTAVVRTFKSWNGQGVRSSRSGRRSHLPIVAGVCVLWVDGPVLFAGRRGCERMVRHRCRCGCCVYDPLLSLQIRRLHDIGASGWWILLAVFLPYIGPMVLCSWPCYRVNLIQTSTIVMMVLGPEPAKSFLKFRRKRQTMLSYRKASGTPVHHEARVTCLEENRQSTLEVAQKNCDAESVPADRQRTDASG